MHKYIATEWMKEIGKDFLKLKLSQFELFYEFFRLSVRAKHNGAIWFLTSNLTDRKTPPLWRDLVRKPRHASSLSLECTDFKNVIFENSPWAPSFVAEVAEVKLPQNPQRRKF